MFKWTVFVEGTDIGSFKSDNDNIIDAFREARELFGPNAVPFFLFSK